MEVAYDGSYSDRIEMSIRQDYLPQQYWIPGSLNARDTAAQALLTANVTNPYTLANFAALRTTDPVLYQRMSANGFFTATTVQRNRLLRPFSHINNLTFSNLPLGEVKVHSLQINVNRRFSGGFTANAADVVQQQPGRIARSRSTTACRRCGWTTTTAGRSACRAARCTSCRSAPASRC